MGAACANSGNTARRTGRKGALPATARSTMASIRSVLARIERRSVGFGMSVWHAAAEYLTGSSISTVPPGGGIQKEAWGRSRALAESVLNNDDRQQEDAAQDSLPVRAYPIALVIEDIEE